MQVLRTSAPQQDRGAADKGSGIRSQGVTSKFGHSPPRAFIAPSPYLSPHVFKKLRTVVESALREEADVRRLTRLSLPVGRSYINGIISLENLFFQSKRLVYTGNF